MTEPEQEKFKTLGTCVLFFGIGTVITIVSLRLHYTTPFVIGILIIVGSLSDTFRVGKRTPRVKNER
jgi:hypothetical protein